jgi:carotenoid cleavage dioxygenase
MTSYLEGNLAPVPDEISATDLPVTGTLPPELTGRFFRNGPNPRPGQDPGHWFAGDGMLHGVRLRDGRAEWYRNRWTRTRKFTDDAQYVTEQGIDYTAVTANTSVIRHAGRILALVEAGFPYEVTPELETVGPHDFGGLLTTSMTAHPKALDDELHFFGYGFAPPFLTYHRLSAAGALVESRVIDVPGPTMMHDFAVTESHVVWLDLPVVFSLDRLGTGLPFGWEDSYGARIGVMRRSDGHTQWFDVDPCYVFHTGNARENAAGQIVLDAVRYSPADFVRIWERISGSDDPASQAPGGHLHRWSFDLASGTVKEERLDDHAVEFPTFNEGRLGRSSRFLYTVSDDGIVKYDTESGTSQVRDLGAEPGEAVFVPRGKTEDDGWLMSVVTGDTGSALRIFDAGSLEDVALVGLPRRVPAGFHGNWFGDLS